MLSTAYRIYFVMFIMYNLKNIKYIFTITIYVKLNTLIKLHFVKCTRMRIEMWKTILESFPRTGTVRKKCPFFCSSVQYIYCTEQKNLICFYFVYIF